MVIAHHIILTSYGHWLPNDPRGSMSTHVWSRKLQALGEPHYERKNKQPSVGDLKSFHRRAEGALHYEPLWFDATTRLVIADAFGAVITQNRYMCHACSILSNHAHLIIRKYFQWVEQMVEQFKDESAQRVRAHLGVADDHPIWVDKARHPFICSRKHLRDAIRYVKENPLKAGLPEQVYGFVVDCGE